MAEPGRRKFTVFVVAQVLIFTGIGSVVLMANENRNLNRLLVSLGFDPIPSSQSANDLLPDATGSEEPQPKVIILPEKLIGPGEVTQAMSFRLTIRRSPEDICNELQAKGLVNVDWTAADLGEQAWECSNEIPVGDVEEGKPSEGSLYVSVRGLNRSQVSSVRLKVNFLSGAISSSVLQRWVNATTDIFSAIGWGNDPKILRHLNNLEEFEIKGNGNEVSLFREFTEIPRYNFLIVSDTPDGEERKARNAGARKKWLESPGSGE